MATTRKPKASAEKIVLVNPDTGELTDLPDDVLPNRNREPLDTTLNHEVHAKKHWNRDRDFMEENLFGGWKAAGIALTCIAVGAVLGIWGQPIIQRQTESAQLYAAMKTSIPVVNAMEVAMDPGKYANKLTDVIMTPTSGAVFKSRKGLFLSENSLGLSLTIFESAFEVFQEAYKVETADDIAPYLIGKTIKARGVVLNRMQPDGTFRTSMIISAPGLIQILPDKP